MPGESVYDENTHGAAQYLLSPKRGSRGLQKRDPNVFRDDDHNGEKQMPSNSEIPVKMSILRAEPAKPLGVSPFTANKTSKININLTLSPLKNSYAKNSEVTLVPSSVLTRLLSNESEKKDLRSVAK